METVRQTRPEVLDLLRPLQANATRLMGVGEKLDLNVKALREKIELAREQANRVSLGLQDDAKKSHMLRVIDLNAYVMLPVRDENDTLHMYVASERGSLDTFDASKGNDT